MLDSDHSGIVSSHRKRPLLVGLRHDVLRIRVWRTHCAIAHRHVGTQESCPAGAAGDHVLRLCFLCSISQSPCAGSHLQRCRGSNNVDGTGRLLQQGCISHSSRNSGRADSGGGGGGAEEAFWIFRIGVPIGPYGLQGDQFIDSGQMRARAGGPCRLRHLPGPLSRGLLPLAAPTGARLHHSRAKGLRRSRAGHGHRATPGGSNDAAHGANEPGLRNGHRLLPSRGDASGRRGPWPGVGWVPLRPRRPEWRRLVGCVHVAHHQLRERGSPCHECGRSVFCYQLQPGLVTVVYRVVRALIRLLPVRRRAGCVARAHHGFVRGILALQPTGCLREP
mmetsp:Transcript_55913/g.154843  ORF Transcript_55913/g.154843 Transcript_55913/m.154843 type:complete len:334 (+) Transcript_55913:176-1177(+)